MKRAVWPLCVYWRGNGVTPEYIELRLSSSLKFCVIAEGHGDIYSRFGETSEWAGGGVVDFQGEALQYNTKDSVENPAFVAIGALAEKDNIIQWIQQKRRAM